MGKGVCETRKYSLWLPSSCGEEEKAVGLYLTSEESLERCL